MYDAAPVIRLDLSRPINVSSLALVLICCSTPVNATSCCVNCVESIGDSGSWFLSCVVSSVRKLLKSPESLLIASDVLAPEVLGVGAVVLVGATLDMVGSFLGPALRHEHQRE